MDFSGSKKLEKQGSRINRLSRAGLVAGALMLFTAVGCTQFMAQGEFDNAIVVETQRGWPEDAGAILSASTAELEYQGYTIAEQTGSKIVTAKGRSSLSSKPGTYAYLEVSVTPGADGTSVEVREYHHLIDDNGKSRSFDQRLPFMEYYILRRLSPERSGKIEAAAAAKANAYLAEKGKPAQDFKVQYDPDRSSKTLPASVETSTASTGTGQSGGACQLPSRFVASGGGQDCPDGVFTVTPIEGLEGHCSYDLSFTNKDAFHHGGFSRPIGSDLVDGVGDIDGSTKSFKGTVTSAGGYFSVFDRSDMLLCSWNLAP
ncbi:MAG: hypothetical protein U0271_08265 [Polyangiaceae bacterium]